MATTTGQEGRPVHGATAIGPEPPPVHRGKVKSWLSKVFEFDSAGLNWPRGVWVLDVVLVPLVIFWSIGYQQYLISAVLGVIFTALADPGGSYRSRALHIAVYGIVGAGLTALAFGIGADAWGWLALAAFAVTLVAGLAATFGVHRFVAALLLNFWFIIALAIAFGLHQHNLSHHFQITSYTWGQVLAWAGGSALWVVVALIAWLIRGRKDVAQPIAEIPGDTSRRPLTRAVIMFAAIRAVVMGGTVALAFGQNLSHGLWLPIAALIAMRPSLAQSTIMSAQRLIGAAIGAGVAALLLLIPANETGFQLLSITRGLEVVALVIFMHGAAIRFWNYAVYTAAVATGVLILVDLPQPSNYGAEGYRILWTLCGVGIGVAVMLLAGLLGRHAAKAPPHPA